MDIRGTAAGVSTGYSSLRPSLTLTVSLEAIYFLADTRLKDTLISFKTLLNKS